MLTELPQSEWERLHAARDQIINEAVSTGTDYEAIEAAVRECYRYIGEDAPAIVWVDGPLHVVLAGWIVDETLKPRGQLGDQLRDQLGGQLRGQLGGQLWGQLGGQLWGQLRDQLRDQLRGQLGDQLGDQLRDQHVKSVDLYWLYWLAHWGLINSIDGITPVPNDLADKTSAMIGALRCHYWIPKRGVCIMSRRHTSIQRDNQGRLHSPAGPAWAWGDGTQIWALEGIRLPEWAVTDPDPARIIAELPNTEQRRVALSNYGWAKAVYDLGLKEIDVNQDPHLGTLYELPDSVSDGQATLLVCRNASPHVDSGEYETYGLLASPDARTVVEAQASLAGLSVGEWSDLAVAT